MTPADRARVVIAQHLGLPITAIVDDAALVADLGADSLDRYELAVLLEDNFHLEFDNDAIAELHTVADVIAFVEKAMGAIS